ncbi:hypothetical protein HHI36_022825 [Cryptolaemus montrouzieri]
MHRIICFYVLIIPIVSESWSPIEDIPIEYFQPEDYQESHIDHEILLRPSRTATSSLGEVDLKERFFRSFDDETFPESKSDDTNLPKLGGFPPYSRKSYLSEARSKREISEEPLLTQKVKVKGGIEDELGTGPLELDTLNPLKDTSVSTESSGPTAFTASPGDSLKNNLIMINDFIRFKRRAEDISKEDNGITKKISEPTSENRQKRERQIFKKSASISLANENHELESNREPRGLTRQEWVKFPYRLQENNERYDDSAAASTDVVKAPRVHFVTQRRSDSVENPLLYRNERQGRDSDLPREARGSVREREPSFSPRFPRRYEPAYPQFRYDARRDDFRGRYDERDLVEDRRFSALPPPPNYSGNRQRRIIYYANLPEITRSPPGTDFRDRYRYRPDYDERYPVEGYRRKIYEKPLFDEASRNKSPYPQSINRC